MRRYWRSMLRQRRAAASALCALVVVGAIATADVGPFNGTSPAPSGSPTETSSPSSTAATVVTPSARVNSVLNVRPDPSLHDEPIGTLEPGQQALLLGSLPGWYEIRLDSGEPGFVSKLWSETKALDKHPAASFLPSASAAAGSTSSELYIRVVDVGPGLCVIIAAPGPHYFVYDAGTWTGSRCFGAAKEIIGDGTTKSDLRHQIDLMVLSHDDADHLGDAAKLVQSYGVKEVFWTGLKRDTTAWRETRDALAPKSGSRVGRVINLQSTDLPPGTERNLGSAKVTVLAGWGDCPFPLAQANQRRNALSIVVRLDFDGKSLLLTGDTVGRSPSRSDCVAAERLMIEQEAVRPLLDADVLVAPHHGADNASCAQFIRAVSPQFVVFSAGSRHFHPRATTAQRYLDAGIKRANIFRTDRHDDEGEHEWNYLRLEGCTDPAGDDDVEIRFARGSETIDVQYRRADVFSAQACRFNQHTTLPQPSIPSQGTQPHQRARVPRRN